MKIQQKFAAALIVLLIGSNMVLPLAVKADQQPEETLLSVESSFRESSDDALAAESADDIEEETSTFFDDTLSPESTDDSKEESSTSLGDITSANPAISDVEESSLSSGETLSPESAADSKEESSASLDDITSANPADSDVEESSPSKDVLAPESPDDTEKETLPFFDDVLQPESPKETEEETFSFSAAIEYSNQGWIAKASFEFPSDIIHIQPLYSLDGQTFHPCLMAGNSYHVETQWLTCLYSTHEPLKSYLEEKIDRFYLKLRLTSKNGTIYETQAEELERENQQISDEITISAAFAPIIRAIIRNPYTYYCKYQLTVPPEATGESISEFLPDTLPIQISFYKENRIWTMGIVDCPVTWKPLSLPPLSAGSSVIISDAAEEIVVPEGTQVSTPLGSFSLKEPLDLNHRPSTDEVRLVLNVTPEDGNPSGVLAEDRSGLTMAFDLKPTGATAIQTYVLTSDDSEWEVLSQTLLLEAVDAQPLTASSGYSLVLNKTMEPYRSYLAAKEAGEESEPFYIGLKIEGGVYDGRQLILPWPSTYHIPPPIPTVGGSGGNEGNAGSDNKGDSTGEGQRPNLPQNPEPTPETSADDSENAPMSSAPQNPEPTPETSADSSENTPTPSTPQNPETPPETRAASNEDSLETRSHNNVEALNLPSSNALSDDCLQNQEGERQPETTTLAMEPPVNELSHENPILFEAASPQPPVVQAAIGIPAAPPKINEEETPETIAESKPSPPEVRISTGALVSSHTETFGHKPFPPLARAAIAGICSMFLVLFGSLLYRK